MAAAFLGRKNQKAFFFLREKERLVLGRERRGDVARFQVRFLCGKDHERTWKKYAGHKKKPR